MTTRKQDQVFSNEELATKLQAEQEKLTWEGLASVDAGRVVDQLVVRSWADRLMSDRDSSSSQSDERSCEFSPGAHKGC